MRGVSMKNIIYDEYIKDFRTNLLNCKFLGKGHNGIVYQLPNGKVIKICFTEKSCRNEYYILNRIRRNKYFPRTYGMCGNYMIRDFVEGITLKDYIKYNGMSRELVLKIVDLFEEFRKLKFSKEDIRCKDIMVQPNGTLMIIDPKKFYSKKRDFPRHLSKGLYKLGVLDSFMAILQKEKPSLYKKWDRKVQEYIKETFDE
jgi:predicted Ser/Thr protein kinase